MTSKTPRAKGAKIPTVPAAQARKETSFTTESTGGSPLSASMTRAAAAT